MRPRTSAILLPAVLLLLTACDPSIRSRDAINLPEGDAARGKELFVSLGCVSCHLVIDEQLPETDRPDDSAVLLGSHTSTALTYGQLVTSIVNPSHRLSARYRKDVVSADGESKMRVYNDVLTVSQLVDLVAFLAPRYERVDRPGYKYPVYSYGDDEETE